jgi:hypothetical protein
MHGGRRAGARSSLAALAALLLASGGQLAAAAETKRVAPNPEYEASGLHTFWFGGGYRDLWTTPVELEVLDLEKEAGGLTVFRQVGGMQTPGLAFTGADGRSYTFRWIDKDPSRLLPEEWRDTVVADYVKDQTAASHPGNWPVLMGLAEGIGIFPFTPQRLVVMPDDPVLGEHRELFGGSIGSFGEYPMPAHDDLPGFMGATEIVSSKELWNRWREGSTVSCLSGGGSSTCGPATGIVTGASGGGAGSRRRRCGCRSPRTPTRRSRTTGACSSASPA